MRTQIKRQALRNVIQSVIQELPFALPRQSGSKFRVIVMRHSLYLAFRTDNLKEIRIFTELSTMSIFPAFN